MKLSFFTLLFCLLLSFSLDAQIDCGMNYLMNSNSSQIMMYNPVTGTTTSTGIPLPNGAGGLAISENLNGGSPSPTFYTIVNGNFWYWNGTTWVNTGHSCGNVSAINPGGSGPYIYTLNGLAGIVYRYDGTGNAVQVASFPNYNGPFDLIGDSQGNFYVLHGGGGNQSFSVYSPQGQLICTYTISGLPSTSAGGGYSVVNGILYATIDSGTYQGIFNGNTITFTQIAAISASDFASCAFPPFNTTITSSNGTSTIDICNNEQVTLTGSSNITSPTFTWSGPGIVSGNGTANIVVNQPGTYTLVVNSTSGNCASTTTTTFELTTGTSSATITPQSPLCINSNDVQLTASSSDGTWTATCGSCVSATGIFSPATAGVGSHTITYTANGGCSAGVANTTVVVAALPAVSAGVDQTVCPGASVTLNGSGAPNLTWSHNISNGVSFVPTATTTYTLTGVDANNCINTDDVTVTVGSLVTPSFDQVAPICHGDVLNALPTTSLNNISGTWSPSLNNLTTTTYTFTPSDVCTSVASMTIVVNPLPVINAGQDVAFCDGTMVTLLATGTQNITWNSGVLNNVPFQPTVGLTNYQATGIDSNGCQNSDVVQVTIFPNPIVNAGVDQYICIGDSVVLNGQGAFSYTWTGTSNGVYFKPVTTTNYIVTGTDLNGCVGMDTVTVFVYPNPIASFTIENPELSSLNSSVEVNNNSVNATSYVWDFGDNSTYYTTNPTHTYPETYGSYTIQLVAISGEGCSDTTSKTVFVREDLLFFIPNAFTPDGDEYNQVFQPVFTSGFDPFNYKFTIYNRWGEKIFESRDALMGWDGTYAGNMCPNGAYTWTIEFKAFNTDERKSINGHFNLLR